MQQHKLVHFEHDQSKYYEYDLTTQFLSSATASLLAANLFDPGADDPPLGIYNQKINYITKFI